MKWDDGTRGHASFNLDGGLRRGVKSIIQAARDPVQVPTEPAIVDLLAKFFCTCRLGEDCYIVSGAGGGERTVRYGAPLSDWETATADLFMEAMKDP